MLVEGLVIDVRSADKGIAVLTDAMVDVEMLDGVEIIVVGAVVITLEFEVLISYVLDVVAGAIICCVFEIGVDVLTDTNVIFLTVPAEEAMPFC